MEPGAIDRLRRVVFSGGRVVLAIADPLAAPDGAAPGPWEGYPKDAIEAPGAFARDPEIVWKYHNWLRERANSRGPGEAHRALVKIEERLPGGLTLVTLSADGLERRAGVRKILELAGSLWRVRCPRCQKGWEDARTPLPFPTPCGACGEAVRPDVVLYGETHDPEIVDKALKASAVAKTFLVLGRPDTLQPFAALVIRAREGGAQIVEVAPQTTPFARFAHHSIQAEASEALVAIVG